MKKLLFLLIGVLVILTVPNKNLVASAYIDDISRLNKTRVAGVVRPKSLKDLQTLVTYAKQHIYKIAIAGKRYSQGGQTLCKNCIIIDTQCLNNVIALDMVRKTITVQPGITWKRLQEYVSPHGLSVKAMQSYNDFTVGGSLSVNVHGQDITGGSLISTVLELKILLADGSIVSASTSENTELFRLVIGGYGLFGIIVEVTLLLTDDIMLNKKVTSIDTHEYYRFFHKRIKNNPRVALHSARLSVDPDALFNKTLAITYYKTGDYIPGGYELKPTRHDGNVQKVGFNLLRHFDIAKKLRFFIESNFIEKPEIISRNNAMRYSVKDLDFGDGTSTNILQEYFVPTEKLEAFLTKLRESIKRYNINLLNVTIRYVPRDKKSFLPYARTDSFALVLYINHKIKQSDIYTIASWTRHIINAVLACNGTFYLPYQLYATHKQLKKAYPMIHEFFELKKKYDSQELFSNALYIRYSSLGI